MLDQERVDGCVCIMPAEHIVTNGIMLLERGIPCVIEKPLGTSLAEIEKLSAAATGTRTPHMVSVNRRFMPFLNRARTWTREHGAPEYVRATQVRDARSEPDFIWSTAVHVIDAMRFLMASEIVSCETEVQRGGSLSTIWYVIALHFANGSTGRVEVLPTAGMVEESYELFGEGFRTRVTAGSGTQRSLECWLRGKLVLDERASEDEPEDLRNGAYQEVEEFVHALRAGMRPHPEIQHILPSVRTCFAIADYVAQKSAAETNAATI